MSELALLAEKAVANYVKRKGFAEIFVRDSKGRCISIGKALLKAAEKGQQNNVVNAAANAAKKLGLSGNNLAAFQNDLLKQINPNGIRKQLGKLVAGQAQNNVMLKDMAKNVSGIFSAVSSIQAVSWLNVALSAANLAATVASTVIICNKLDHIDKKLDRIESKIDSVKRVQFATDIKQPCRSVIKQYKVISDELKNGKAVPAEDILKVINACSDEMEKIYDVRTEYSTGTVLELLYDLMPVLTDLIVQYYTNYYDPERGEYTLHQDWMKIYDMLDSDEFKAQVEDYLIFEEGLGNVELNEVMDCRHLVTVGSRMKIEEVLSDIKMCDSTEDYREIRQFCDQYALQQAKAMEADLQSELGVAEASRIIEQAKIQYMYAS